ncbi:MAG TPA: DUF3379 family protein [Steroidobacteraceae bacterium]
MNCERARLEIGADPQAVSELLAVHLAQCAACDAFRAETLALDAHIRRALDLPLAVPGRAPSRPVAVRPRPPQRWYALAASVVAACALAVGLWALRPRESLAGALITHVNEEPASWGMVAPVSPMLLDRILQRSGVHLALAAGEVTYAQSCWFRGRYVPHLVVHTQQGAVTVIVLPGESVGREQRFDEGGYRGVILAAPHGAVAVLGHEGADVDAAARRVLQALR